MVRDPAFYGHDSCIAEDYRDEHVGFDCEDQAEVGEGREGGYVLTARGDDGKKQLNKVKVLTSEEMKGLCASVTSSRWL